MCINNMQVGLNINEECMLGWCDLCNFIIVFDLYLIVSVLVVDLILLIVMWVEKEGVYGNVECCIQFWCQQVQVLGEAKLDFWQLVQFFCCFKIEEVWLEELLVKKLELCGKMLYEVLYVIFEVSKFLVFELVEDQLNDEFCELGFYL